MAFREVAEYVTIEDVDEGYRDCGKRKGNTEGYMEYSENYLLNNLQLHNELNSMTYEIGKSKTFCVTRPTLREVFCAQFRDRIVHHVLAIKFLPIFEAEMTDNAYACRKGKGTDYGIDHIRRQIERISEDYTKETWILKCDLQGFFMSINRKMLYDIVEQMIREKYHGDDIDFWLWLWKKVIMNDPSENCVKVGDLSLWEKLPKNKSLFTCGEGKGLPIGNLPSQILANLLLSRFDKWVLRRVGTDGGYGRYVDDFVVLGKDKRKLLSILHDARVFLHDEFGLTLHPKKVYLQEARKGVKMTGSVIKPHRVYAGNNTVEHLFEVVRKWNKIKNPTPEDTEKFVTRINSLFGHIVHRESYAIRWRAWREMKHKDRIYCLNIRCLRVKRLNTNKHKKEKYEKGEFYQDARRKERL